MTTYPGSGILTQFYGPQAEVTYGVVPSLTGGHFYAVKGGESLKGKKVTAQGEGLFAGALYPQSARRVLSGWDPAGGGIPLELPTRNLQQWLYPMFGSYGQTPAALAEDATTGAYSAVHAPGPLQSHSFVVQKGVPTVDGTVEPFTYSGCKVSEWELSVAKHGIAQLALTVTARNELAGAGNSDPLNDDVPSLVSYSKPTGGVFHWAQASLYTGGTVSTSDGVTSVDSPTLAGNIKSISVKHTVPLDLDRYFLGAGGFMGEPVDNGLRSVAVSFEVEWLSAEAYYDAWSGDTATAIEVSLTGDSIGTGPDFSAFSLLIPEMFLGGEASPVVEGTQVVTQKLEYEGLDDGTDNVIQGTYWTLDTA